MEPVQSERPVEAATPAAPATHDWRVVVRVDDRVRAMGMALAGTDWPERERRQGLAKAHVVAQHARAWMAPYGAHPAVAAVQDLLACGASVRALYTYVLGLTPDFRPDRKPTGLLAEPCPGLDTAVLGEQLGALRVEARLDAFWQMTQASWGHAAADAGEVLSDARVIEFLGLCFGERRLPVFVPNLLYPALSTLGIAAGGEAVCICPPPQAVGESKPWHYGDDPEWTQTVAFRECCRATLWGLPWSQLVEAATIDLLAAAATVIFLRESGDELGARALMLMEIRRQGQTGLPGAVDALGAYVAARQSRREGQDMMAGLRTALGTVTEG